MPLNECLSGNFFEYYFLHQKEKCLNLQYKNHYRL